MENQQNFYDGIIIDYDDVISQQKFSTMEQFYNELKSKSLACNNASYNTNRTAIIDYAPIPGLSQRANNIVRGVIIVLPISYINSLDSTSFFTRGAEIVNNSIGHCWFIWDKTKDICSIYDLCSYNLNTPNIGTVLLESILETFLTKLPNSTTLWYGIDLKNQLFPKIVRLCTKFDFKNPYISYVDPYGFNYEQTMEFGFLCLTRPNDYIDEDEIDRQSIENEIIYVISQYIKLNTTGLKSKSLEVINYSKQYYLNKEDESSCTLKCVFKKSYARWLNKLSTKSSTLNADGTVTQKEIGGVFDLVILEKTDNDIIWQIIGDKNKIVSGSELEVQIPFVRYNFHTHPSDTYILFNASIGFPSGDDYLAFLQHNYISNCIFTAVITKEGIYIISLNKNRIIKENQDKLKEMQTKIISSIDNMQKFKQYYQLDRTNYSNNNVIDAANKYCNDINNHNIDNDGPLFRCDFYTWPQIIQQDIIQINYPIVYNQCLPTDNSINTIKTIHNVV
jgi:hypothetical protein